MITLRRHWLLFLTLAAACLAIYWRIYPLTAYPDYAAKHASMMTIYSMMHKNVDERIRERFSDQPPDRIKNLSDLQFKLLMGRQKLKVEASVEKSARPLRTLFKQDMRYLPEVDPYYYKSLVRNLLANGKISDIIKGRNYFNPKMLAPVGSWYPLDFHAYTGFFVYKFLCLFKPSLELDTALSLVPLALAILCVLAFAWLLRAVFNLGFVGCFAALFFFVSCPIFIKRSVYGWFDTDPYNVLFPALLVLAYGFLLIQYSLERKKTLIVSFSTALLTAVYSLFWRGWMLVFGVSTLAAVATLLLSPKKIHREAPLALGLSFLFLNGLLLLFWGPLGLAETYQDAFTFAADFFKPPISAWPDVFVTVGELRPLNFQSLARLLTHPVIVFICFLGLVWNIRHFRRHSDPRYPAVLFASLYMLLFFVIALSGERFALFLVLPVSVALGLLAERLKAFSAQIAAQTRRRICYLLFLVPLALFIFYQYEQTKREIRVQHPIYNAAWDKMMAKIREETPSDSIVTSWWSPGHFITGMGQRRVTFDGATQNTPQAYWVARLFLESSEEKALAILRMLNYSGNKAVEFLASKKIALPDSIDLLSEILPLKYEDAAKRLENVLPDEKDRSHLLNLTHPVEPLPPSYVFVYDDMITQAMALEFIGNWNFKKANTYRKNPPANIGKKGSAENVRFLWTLSDGPWPSDPEAYVTKESATSWTFTNGLILNKDFSGALLMSSKFGNGRPQFLYIIRGSYLEKIDLPKPDMGLGILLIPYKESYKCVLADPRLLESLAFRLFYLQGAGLRHFKLVGYEKDERLQNEFALFQVDWD